MTSIFIQAVPRKRSKNDLRQIQEQQEKIGQMVHGFYERIRTKLTKSLTKCENKNVLICRELFDSLTLHPQQELYETIRIHDLIFNEIDQAAQAIVEFSRKMDALYDRLKGELAVQQERSTIKREKGPVGENAIAVLRKVSFKREKHALKNRLLSLDTINKKLLKCEAAPQEEQQAGFHLDIQGKKTEALVFAYSKIWFESKRREYLLCLTQQNRLCLFNDKLQTVAAFPAPHHLPLPVNFLQVGNYVFIVTPYQVTRINLLNQTDILSKKYRKQILRAESYNGGLVLWAVDRERQHSVLFTDEYLSIFSEVDLRLSTAGIPSHFRLNGSLYFLTSSATQQAEVLKLQGGDIVQVCQVGRVEEVIPVRCGKETEEVIFRMQGNRFVKFVDGAVVGLEVEIDQSESIRSCAVLGEHFYALSENGKAMLECHYQPPLEPPS